MIVMMIIAVAVPVTVPPVTVPPMVMIEPSPGTIPISPVILAAVIAWRYPGRTRIRRPRPVSVMPAIVAAIRIPISVDPDISRSRLTRMNTQNPGRWWRADPNTK